VFPSGLGYDKSNSEVQTFKTNSIFSSIALLSGSLPKEKSGKPVDFNQLSALVTLRGESSNFFTEDLQRIIDYR
jgi:hypothetical protein